MKSLRVSGVLVYLFLLAVALLLYFFYLYLPLSQKTQELNALHLENTAAIASYENDLKNLEAMLAENENMQFQADAIRDAPSVPGQLVADDLNRAANKTGVFFRSISVDAPTQDEEIGPSGRILNRAPVSLTFLASQTQLEALVDYFENQSQGTYLIQNISCKEAEASEGNVVSSSPSPYAPSLDVQMTLTLSYYTDLTELSGSSSSSQGGAQ